MNRKVVINSCYGGFSLSNLARQTYYKLKNPGKKLYFYKVKSVGKEYKKMSDEEAYKNNNDLFVTVFTEDLGDSFSITKNTPSELYDKFHNSYWWDHDISRHDEDLVKVVETLGSEKASGSCAKLEVVDIGDSMYRINEYDGYESIEFPKDIEWL